MQSLTFLQGSALSLIALGFSAGLGEAAPRQGSKVTQIPKTAGTSLYTSVDKHAGAAPDDSKIDFSTPKGFEPNVSSGYRMDGSKQDRSYELVSMPMGRATDSLPDTPLPNR